MTVLGTTDHDRAECARLIDRDPWTYSGFRKDEDRWTCSCGRVYVHICDEAEGCAWWPVSSPATSQNQHLAEPVITREDVDGLLQATGHDPADLNISEQPKEDE